MTPKELAREKRRQKYFERLGTSTPRCSGCGETDPRVFEAHHIAGRRYDSVTTPLCVNCHRKVTDDQHDHPDRNKGGDRFLEQVGHFLLGLADLLRLAIERLVAFGEALIERARTASPKDAEVRS